MLLSTHVKRVSVSRMGDFLFTVGGFCNKREYSGADWLDLLIYNFWIFIIVIIDLWRDWMSFEFWLLHFLYQFIRHFLTVFFLQFAIIFIPVWCTLSFIPIFPQLQWTAWYSYALSPNNFLLKNDLFLPTYQRHLASKISNTLVVVHSIRVSQKNSNL